MDKETLFKKIIQGEVLLWAGAGLSRYAGYPMGPGVAAKLFESLSAPQKQKLADEVDKTVEQFQRELPPLPDFAEMFLTLHHDNRHELNSIVRDIFRQPPSSTETHKLLAQLPFFQHIVTTNYDELFEQTDPSREVITNSADLPYLQNRSALYKIHGHLKDLDSLIIASRDYARFFDTADPLLWNQLQALMVTKTILFVGYAVEDPNVLAAFFRVLDKLGANMRPAYVVGPDMRPMQIQKLQGRNVNYIKATGEQFVAELFDYVKKKVFPELANGNISLVPPVNQMLDKLGLDLNMSLESGRAQVKEIKRREGETSRGYHYRVAAGTPQHQALSELTTGQRLRPVRLQTPDVEFTHTVEGFHLPGETDLVGMLVTRAPGLDKIVDVRSPDGTYECKGVRLLTFYRPQVLHILALTEAARYELILRVVPGTRKLKPAGTLHTRKRPTELFESVEIGLQFAEQLMRLGSGEPLDVYENGELFYRLPARPAGLVHGEAQRMQEVMASLRTIEQAFQISFRNFEVTDHDADQISELAAILTQQPREYNSWDGKMEVPMGEEDLPEGIGKKDFRQMLLNRQPDYELHIPEMETALSFQIMGWHLRVEFIDMLHLPEPKFKRRPNGLYRITSRNGVLNRLSREVTACIVRKPAPLVEVPELSVMQRLAELMPEEDLELPIDSD